MAEYMKTLFVSSFFAVDMMSMQEIVKAQKNVELFFAEEKDSKQVEQIR